MRDLAQAARKSSCRSRVQSGWREILRFAQDDKCRARDENASVRILIAPDKFKGSLNAREVAENIAKGLRDSLSGAKIEIVPMADGGEGTAEAICEACSGSWVKCKARDPVGREIEARYAWIEGERLTNRGAKQITIGLGGSATNDGGFGMARALGFRFFSHGQELADGVNELTKLTEIILPEKVVGALVSGAQSKDMRLTQPPLQRVLPKMIAAVDVQNPLLGENGATRVFGPQKGASKDELNVLERALTRLADVVAKEFDFDYRDKPGAGAAGGLGFGLMSFCGATIRPGFDVVAEAVGLESKMKEVDVVITGEGSLDRQTLEGKTPAGVAKLARKLGKKVFAIAGRYDGDQQVRKLFDDVCQLARSGISEEEQMKRAGELLREKAQELARTF